MTACKNVWRGLWLNRKARRCPVARDHPLMYRLVRQPRYNLLNLAPVWTVQGLA